MTPRERVQAALDRRLPDRLPREIKLTPPLMEAFEQRTGASDPADYYELEVRDVYFAPPTELADFSKYYPNGVPRLWNPAGWEVGEWGVGVSVPPAICHAPHTFSSPEFRGRTSRPT